MGHCLLLIFLSSIPVFAWGPGVVNYFNSHGLPQSQVLALAQDDLGALWIGTYCGLARYNGRTFQTFTIHDGLPINYVHHLKVQSKERIWGVTPEGGFVVTPPLKIETPPSLQREGLLDILPLNGKSYLFADREGIYLYKKGKVKTLLAQSIPRKAKVFRSFNAKLYVGTGTQLYLFDRDQLIPFLSLPDQIFNFYPTKKGIYLLSMDRFYFYDGKHYQIIIENIQGNDIAVQGENVALASDTGLYLWTAKGSYHLTEKEGLANNACQVLLWDKEKTLWIGTNHGLSKIPYLNIILFGMEDGLPSPSMWCLYEDPLWGFLVAGNGGICRWNGQSFQKIHLPSLPLEKFIIRALHRDKDQALWVGTFHGGLWRYRDGKTTRFPIDIVFSITEHQESLWFGTNRGLYRYHQGSFQNWTKEQGLLDNYVWQVFVDRKNRLWIVTDKGLMMLQEGKPQVPSFAQALRGINLRCIAEDDQGNLWIGSNGHGLFQWDGKSLKNYQKNQKFPDDVVWGILPNPTGTLWVGTNRGLVLFSQGRYRIFNTQDGLAGDELNLHGLLRDAQGNCWFFLPPKLVSIKGNLDHLLTTRGTLNLWLRIHGRLKRWDKKTLILPPSERTLLCLPEALTFKDETDVRIQTRLLPSQKSWSAFHPVEPLHFVNLKPGKTTLEIRTCFDKPEDPPLRVSFYIKPYIYETLLFKIFLAGLFFLAGFCLFRWRLKVVENRKKQLEDIVKARMQELYERSIRDDLTGVFNRRFFEETMEKRIQESKEGMLPIAMAFLDLDNFKEVNDTYGHIVGDQVLKRCAQILQQSIRRDDFLARFGGDEFVIVLWDCPFPKANLRLRNVLDTLIQEEFKIGSRAFHISASIGSIYTLLDEKKAMNYDELLRQCDKALMEAKAKGKNQLILYGGSGESLH